MYFKNIIYAFACLSFAVVIGAAIYEHIAVVPRWSAAPPVSLSMFQGKYGLNPAPFWKGIHPVTVLLLVVSIIIFWKTGRRENLMITLVGYVVVLIITFSFFVPELVAITGSGWSGEVDGSLVKRAALWERLSLVRLGVLIVLAVVLFLGLTKEVVRY
jgi:chromate transport protein ChrA